MGDAGRMKLTEREAEVLERYRDTVLQGQQDIFDGQPAAQTTVRAALAVTSKDVAEGKEQEQQRIDTPLHLW